MREIEELPENEFTNKKKVTQKETAKMRGGVHVLANRLDGSVLELARGYWKIVLINRYPRKGNYRNILRKPGDVHATPAFVCIKHANTKLFACTRHMQTTDLRIHKVQTRSGLRPA